MTAMRIVEPSMNLKIATRASIWVLKTPVKQLALEHGKENFAHRVVEPIAH
jgi:hypothetical protein